MRPEGDLDRVLKLVCPNVGHWPHTTDADLYIGFRPAGESLVVSGNRVTATEVEFDIVIKTVQGRSVEMETLRYGLYAALRENGWKLIGDPGPETYDFSEDMYMWPLTAGKRFYMDESGLPETIEELKKLKEG